MADQSTCESLFPKAFSMGEWTLDFFSGKKSFFEMNNGVRTSKYLFLLRNSKENIKSVKINFFKILKISKVLQQSKENFFKKNSWISVTIVSFVSFGFCLFSSPSLLYCDRLENHQGWNTVKASSLPVTGGERLVFELPKATISENCHHLVFLAIPGNLHFQGMPSFNCTQSLLSANYLFYVDIFRNNH